MEHRTFVRAEAGEVRMGCRDCWWGGLIYTARLGFSVAWKGANDSARGHEADPGNCTLRCAS